MRTATGAASGVGLAASPALFRSRGSTVARSLIPRDGCAPAVPLLLRAGAPGGLVVVVIHVTGLQRVALDAAWRVYRGAAHIPSRFLGS